MMRSILLFCVFYTVSVSLLGQQMMSNQGTIISIANQGLLSVEGAIINDEDGQFANQGEIYLTGDWEHNGRLAIFRQNEGDVFLHGGDQHIKGQSISEFYNLHLESFGLKSLDTTTVINNELQLNHLELYTASHEVVVTNPQLNAVQHHQQSGLWGFVSGEKNGGLRRAQNQVADYFYPLGSRQGNFRPLYLEPNNSNLTNCRGVFIDKDANQDNLDRTLKGTDICALNPFFYHEIERTSGTAELKPKLTYNTQSDGNYTGIAQWDNQWNKLSEGNNNISGAFNLNVLTSQRLIRDYTKHNFILSGNGLLELRNNIDSFCSTELLVLQATGDSYSNYDFYLNDLLIQSSSNADLSIRDVDAGIVKVRVEASNSACAQTDSLELMVLQGAYPNAGRDTIITRGSVANLQAKGGDFYTWGPNVNLSCTNCSNPEARPLDDQIYTLLVETFDGCMGMDTVKVSVEEDIASILFIPNVLTPNNDGKNDSWFIQNIDNYLSNRVTILNRWGDTVFETNNYNNDWIGNFGGKPLPSGTYYYVIDLGISDTSIFKGTVTIIR